jgi:hypothetical protein
MRSTMLDNVSKRQGCGNVALPGSQETGTIGKPLASFARIESIHIQSSAPSLTLVF